jgi:hypothetical protein
MLQFDLQKKLYQNFKARETFQGRLSKESFPAKAFQRKLSRGNFPGGKEGWNSQFFPRL